MADIEEAQTEEGTTMPEETTSNVDTDPKPKEEETVEPGEWQTEKYRAKVVERIQEEIAKTVSQIPKSAADLEEFAFSKAKSRKNYHDLVARVLIYVTEFNKKKLKEGQEESKEEDPNEGDAKAETAVGEEEKDS